MNHYLAVGRIGFEQEKYNVSEGAGSVDVCAAILEPELSLIARNVQAFLFAETVNGTAIGELLHSVHILFPITPTHMHIF